MATLLEELRRRNVIKVAAAYAAAAWLVAQVAETVFPVFDLPDQLLRALFIALGIGFPVTVILAWIYDLTPEGIRRTDDLPAGSGRVGGRGLDFIIIGCLTVAVLILALDRLVWNPPTSAKFAAVAVLPFTVEQSDAEIEYFGTGIAVQAASANWENNWGSMRYAGEASADATTSSRLLSNSSMSSTARFCGAIASRVTS